MIPRLTLHSDNSNNKLNLGSDKYLRGDDGKSAYEIWLEEGNVGTEEDFLNSLKGTDGTNGKDGSDGKDGYTPVKGTDYWTETDKAEIVADVTEEMDSKGYVSADLTDGEESGVPATVNADTLGGYTLNDVVNKAKPTQAEIAQLIPTASATTKGAVKVGDGLKMTGDVLSVEEGEYELIETITVEEGVTLIERNKEPNGTPYNFKKMHIEIGNINSAGISVAVNDAGVRTAFNSRTNEHVSYGVTTYVAGDNIKIDSFAEIENGLLVVDMTGINVYYNGRDYMKGSDVKLSEGGIKQMLIGHYAGFTEGITIKIWGVRA